MESQPLDKPSAGSVFRNPKDRQAWQMIDELGYRGRRVGGVSVSEKHVNFIVNDQQGKARDFIELVEEIQEQVRRQRSYPLRKLLPQAYSLRTAAVLPHILLFSSAAPVVLHPYACLTSAA